MIFRTALCTAIAAAMLAATATAPSAAEAAKLRISGEAVTVSPQGIAKIRVANPNRSSARGKLSLRSAGRIIASKRFRLRARGAKKVPMELTVGAFRKVQERGSLRVEVRAKARGIGSRRRQVTLTSSAPAGGDDPGSGDQGEGDPGGGDPGGDEPPAAGWQDGRYQGTYAENNADLAFNVVGPRLYTGPFDAFYLEATCRNINPEYTGPDQVTTDATAVEPVEATIAADGLFSGEGVYRPSPDMAKNWTLSGRISGGSITDGEFSMSYTDYYGNPCSGVTRFTAGWYGDYTL